MWDFLFFDPSLDFVFGVVDGDDDDDGTNSAPGPSSDVASDNDDDNGDDDDDIFDGIASAELRGSGMDDESCVEARKAGGSDETDGDESKLKEDERSVEERKSARAGGEELWRLGRG